MKKVFFKQRFHGGPYHSLYNITLQHPPDGYHFFTDVVPSGKNLIYDLNRKMLKTSLVKDVWYTAKTLFYLSFQRIDSLHQNFDCDLIFASQQLLFSKVPWVVDVEFANALVGYGNIKLGRRTIQKVLRSNSCQKILPWSNWSKKTLFHSLDCGTFKDKMEIVHIPVSPKNFVKKRKGDRLRLLFVGSTNPTNLHNFDLKGGNETIEAFIKLAKKYDNLELVIRSWVPPLIRERCSTEKNIHVLNSPLSAKELADLFASSDIFVFPSHANLGLAILDAMSYELPVIALGVYDVPEAITDMKTGVLIRPPKDVFYYDWNFGHNYLDERFFPGLQRSRPWLVDQLVEKISLLIEDDVLRRNIAREARYTVEHGDFSLEHRNAQLSRIFEAATKN